MGMKPGIGGQKIYKEKANKYVREKLELPKNSETVVIKRKRTADDKLVLVSTQYVPAHILTRDLQKSDLGQSLSEFLQKECNLDIGCALTIFILDFAGEEIAKELQVSQGFLVLKMEHLDLAMDKIPVCFVIEYFNNSEFSFNIIRKWEK